MANHQQLAILHQGVSLWNQWREERKKEEASFKRINTEQDETESPHLLDLSGANLQELDLHQVNLSGVKLQGTRFVRTNLKEANLSQADLYEALFNQANLEGADVSQASLMQACMADANLRKANLRGAHLYETRFFHAFLVDADLRTTDLTHTNFTWAILHGMNVEGASINHTIFGDVDLSQVKGLAMLHHQRPPIIDIYTLARSSGRISETFLQHAGIDSTIIPSLLALFSPYHEGETVWWSEEAPSPPWFTGETGVTP